MDDPDATTTLAAVREKVREFATERDWQPFHTPKNLATALSVEAAELLEPFRWLQAGERAELTDSDLERIRHEMSDVLMCLVLLADRLEVSLAAAFAEKMALNHEKYPVRKVRGDCRKYDQYE